MKSRLMWIVTLLALQAIPALVAQEQQSTGLNRFQQYTATGSDISTGPSENSCRDSLDPTSILADSVWQLQDEISILTRAEFGNPDTAANSCPTARCSSRHSHGTVCGARLCHIPGPVQLLFRAYDQTSHRACFYGC